MCSIATEIFFPDLVTLVAFAYLFEDKEYAIGVFLRHIEEVKRSVPAKNPRSPREILSAAKNDRRDGTGIVI